eukprot:7972862-Pyramimonas_sp.AAC.1
MCIRDSLSILEGREALPGVVAAAAASSAAPELRRLVFLSRLPPGALDPWTHLSGLGMGSPRVFLVVG